MTEEEFEKAMSEILPEPWQNCLDEIENLIFGNSNIAVRYKDVEIVAALSYIQGFLEWKIKNPKEEISEWSGSFEWEDQMHTSQGFVDHGFSNSGSFNVPGKTGHEAMQLWDKGFKLHHLPMWAKKAIRMNAKKKGNWNAYPSHPVTNRAELHLPSSLFDHWGSISKGEIRALITQPYGNHDFDALEFAVELGWSVSYATPGPWGDGTSYYEFLPLMHDSIDNPSDTSGS